MKGPAPLTVIVLAHDEELNLPRCLASIEGLAAEVFIVDSGSTDRTRAIAEAHGARVVGHPFENHPTQWAWALGALPLTQPWVLALDADQRLTPELAAEIRELLHAPRGGEGDPVGYRIKRQQHFRGRWIRHGGYYPIWLLRLFRRDAADVDLRERVDHHFDVRGPVGHLKNDIIEDNLKEHDIDFVLDRWQGYAKRQAAEEHEYGGPARASRDGTGRPRDRRRATYARLPLFVRPVLYFLWRYVGQFGFLDGRQGFVFHVLQGFWYRLLVDIHLHDLRRQSRATEAK